MKKKKSRERNIYRQHFYFDLLFSYNIKIKVDEYVKLKPSKMNL